MGEVKLLFGHTGLKLFKNQSFSSSSFVIAMVPAGKK